MEALKVLPWLDRNQRGTETAGFFGMLKGPLDLGKPDDFKFGMGYT